LPSSISDAGYFHHRDHRELKEIEQIDFFLSVFSVISVVNSIFPLVVVISWIDPTDDAVGRGRVSRRVRSMGFGSLLERHRLAAYWIVAVAIQILIVVVSLVKSSALGYAHLPVYCDIELYFDFARPILKGHLPYRDYPVEYPVLAIPVFFAPLIAGTKFEAYRIGFVIEMVLLNLWSVWLVARQVAKAEGVERVPGRLAWYTVFFAVLCPMMVVRFDIVPMTCAFAAVYFATSGRSMVGGVLAGVGTLVKLVPCLVLLPVLVVAGPFKPRFRVLEGWAVAVVLGGLLWWSLGGEQVLDSFRYHQVRGLEIGSLYSSIYMAAHKLAGVSIERTFGSGSMNINGPGTKLVASLATIIQGASLLLVGWRARRSAPGQEFRFAAAALLAYMTFGKVLSPQYVIWLVPFLCVLDGPIGQSSRKAYLACALLTNAVYPHLFHPLCFFEGQAVAVLVARNLALIGFFVILMGSTTQANPPRKQDATGDNS
jgi:hypothetical protein